MAMFVVLCILEKGMLKLKEEKGTFGGDSIHVPDARKYADKMYYIKLCIMPQICAGRKWPAHERW